MKYMLFAWEDYEAGGGMKDFVGLFDTVDAAEERFVEGNFREGYNRFQWGHIYCATSLQKVKDL
jgi:hypothetical protein